MWFPRSGAWRQAEIVWSLPPRAQPLARGLSSRGLEARGVPKPARFPQSLRQIATSPSARRFFRFGSSSNSA